MAAKRKLKSGPSEAAKKAKAARKKATRQRLEGPPKLKEKFMPVMTPAMLDHGNGRTTNYTPELAEEILQRMSDGEMLNQICRDPRMPVKSAVLKWKIKDIDGFESRYREARKAMIEHWEEENVDIADDGSNDWIEREVRGGRIITVVDQEHIQRSRLRIETRKWLMSKLRPDQYGERSVQQNQTLDKDGNPITPGPTYIIDRREADAIGEDLEDKV